MPAERAPGSTATVPGATVSGSSKKEAGRPSACRSAAVVRAARSLPASTTQAVRLWSIARKSSERSSVLPPHTESCRAVTLVKVRTGVS